MGVAIMAVTRERAVDAGLRYPIDVAVGPEQDLYILEHIDPDSGYVAESMLRAPSMTSRWDVALREPMGLLL
jgi:hypothetical protein